MATKQKELTAVDLAKDVLALITAKKIQVKAGTYGRFTRKVLQKFKGQPFQQVLRQAKAPTCDVCAMGALFCAFIDKKNEVKVERWDGFEPQFGDDELIISKMAPYFSENQLRLIETAFEGQQMVMINVDWDSQYQYIEAAQQFYARYKSAESRLIAIMENVIENGGKFNPPLTLPVLD